MEHGAQHVIQGGVHQGMRCVIWGLRREVDACASMGCVTASEASA